LLQSPLGTATLVPKSPTLTVTTHDNTHCDAITDAHADRNSCDVHSDTNADAHCDAKLAGAGD